MDQLVSRGTLESIKLLLMFKAADRNGNSWDSLKANKHEVEMIKLLEAEFLQEDE